MSEVLKLKDHINIITVSKGLSKQYQSLEEANTKIEILKDVKNPDLIIAVSGDYLLNEAYKIIEKSNKRIKLVYVTNIKLLDGISPKINIKIIRMIPKIKKLVDHRKDVCSFTQI